MVHLARHSLHSIGTRDHRRIRCRSRLVHSGERGRHYLFNRAFRLGIFSLDQLETREFPDGRQSLTRNFFALLDRARNENQIRLKRRRRERSTRGSGFAWLNIASKSSWYWSASFLSVANVALS